MSAIDCPSRFSANLVLGDLHTRIYNRREGLQADWGKVSGELSAQIGGKCSQMKAGDVVIIPARVKHKFTNRGNQPAVTFNVYSPPEYPAN